MKEVVRWSCLFCWLFYFFTVHASGQDKPVIKRGIIDARDWNFENGSIALDGEWFFYKDKLIDHHDSSNTGFKEVPSLWKGGQGYASYSLLLLIPQGDNNFSLSLPDMYCSYALYANGGKIASNGVVSKDKSTGQPQWMPQVVALPNSTDTVELVLQISNFWHDRGGIKESIYLGHSDILVRQDSIMQIALTGESVILFLLGTGFMIVFFNRRNHKVILWFSFLCINWSVRSIIAGQYIIVRYFPQFDWVAMVKVEYLTLFINMICVVFFLSGLFKRERNKPVGNLIAGINLLFVLLTLLSLPILFTRYLDFYQGVIVLLLIYSLIVVYKALVEDRVGALWMAVSIGLGALVFTYDLLSYRGILTYNSIVSSCGYVLIFLMTAASLLSYLQIIKRRRQTSNELRYEDFYGRS